MLWSREDFVREARRQLVELDSLRRKIEMDSDVTGALERLEEAQLHLLRKLEEYCRARPDEAPSTVPAAMPDAVRQYLRTLLGEPRLREELARRAADDHGEGALALLEAAGPTSRPRFEGTGSSGLAPYALN